MKRLTPILLILALAAPMGADGLDSLLIPLPQLLADADAAAQPPSMKARVQEPAAQQPQGALVGPADILPEIQRILTAQFSPDGELKVSLLTQWRGARVKNEAWRTELVRIPGNGLMPRMLVHLRLLCGDEVQCELQLPVACRLHREVLVPRRQINKGELIATDDFEVQVRDLLESPVPMVPAGEDLSDYELRGSVAPGQPLLWRDISPRPLVRRGQLVELVAAEGFLRISVKGQALENGREGELISVRNLSSNKDIQARIINEQTVQVHF